MTQGKLQFLFFDIDSSHHVFVLEFGRDGKNLSEYVEFEIAANEAHQVVAPGFRFWERGISMTAVIGKFIVDLEVFRNVQAQPDAYNIVAHKDGDNPYCVNSIAASNTSCAQDFALSPASTGEVTGTVNRASFLLKSRYLTMNW